MATKTKTPKTEKPAPETKTKKPATKKPAPKTKKTKSGY